MRILHATPTYLPATRYGGPIVSVHELCKHLAVLGHDVHVFTSSVDGSKNSDVPIGEPVSIDGVKVWYFESKIFRRIFYLPEMGRKLESMINSFDLVHIHGLFTWPVTEAMKYAAQKRIPFIITPRGMLVKEMFKRKSYVLKSLWMILFGNNFFKKACTVHVTSEQEKKDVLQFFEIENKIAYVPNGYIKPADTEMGDDLQEFSREIDRYSPYILYLGRLSWKKNIDSLINAVKNFPEIHLVIAGNDDENYQKIINGILSGNKELSNRVHITGFADTAKKNLLFKKALLTALPSYSENFGMVVIESLASGCPVMVSSGVGLADFVSREGVGMVTGVSPENLKNGLNKMLSDPEKLHEMGKKGRNAVEKHFNWSGIAEQIEKIYADSQNENRSFL